MGRGSSGAGARAKGARASKGAGGGGAGGSATPEAAPAAAARRESKAVVVFSPDYGPKQVETLTGKFKALFGEKFTLQDFASASGSPDTAKVVIDYNPPSMGKPASFVAYTHDASLQNMDRTFTVDKRGQMIIKNDIFVATKSGTGLGLKLFSGQVENATALGFKAIKTEASSSSGYNGYSTWAKFGYNSKLPNSVRDRLPEGLKGARSMHELRRTEAGRQWWDKNGSTTNMRFNLAPGSRSQRVLKGYAAEVASRPPRPTQ